MERVPSTGRRRRGGGALAAAPSAAAAPLTVAFGRELEVEIRGGAARASFAELCAQDVRGRALGAADYALASRVSALFLADIPVLGPTSRNEARRFVHLVDALYENNVRLYASAAAPPAELFAPLLAAAASTEAVDGAEVAVDGGLAARACVVERRRAAVDGGAPSFAVAPVGGAYERDGELSSFFTAKDEGFACRRTLSRLKEMCGT